MMDIRAVWASLPRPAGQTGWQVIAIHPEAHFPIMAGVHLPEGVEGLLVDVPADAMPAGVEYPEASGFEVTPERLGRTRSSPVRICLTRGGRGNPDLFAILAEDVAMRVASQPDAAGAVHALLARIRSWQTFMRHHEGERMSEPEETGLAGELLLLEAALIPGADIAMAIDCWRGPLGALHDFRLGQVAIEVKATASPRNSIRITSFDQLDDSGLSALFLAVVRLGTGTGRTLPELVDRQRTRVRAGAPTHEHALDERLLSAGYVGAHAPLYTRRFVAETIRYYRVGAGFPRLIRSTVPDGVAEGAYDVELRVADRYQVTEATAVAEFLGGSDGTR